MVVVTKDGTRWPCRQGTVVTFDVETAKFGESVFKNVILRYTTEFGTPAKFLVNRVDRIEEF